MLTRSSLKIDIKAPSAMTRSYEPAWATLLYTHFDEISSGPSNLQDIVKFTMIAPEINSRWKELSPIPLSVQLQKSARTRHDDPQVLSITLRIELPQLHSTPQLVASVRESLTFFKNLLRSQLFVQLSRSTETSPDYVGCRLRISMPGSYFEAIEDPEMLLLWLKLFMGKCSASLQEQLTGTAVAWIDTYFEVQPAPIHCMFDFRKFIKTAEWNIFFRLL